MTARAAVLGASLALSGALWAALPSLQDILDPHLPAWAERWLYNPRERMDKAAGAYEQGRPKDGLPAAETALRLAEEDPLVQYGAGTLRLGAGRERPAIELLEKAAKAAAEPAGQKKLPPDLAPDAYYNLGNAKLASRDAGGAAEAYKQALRLAPDHASAKHNLELALREQQKQSQGVGGNRNRQGNRGKNQDQQSGRRGGEGNPDDPSSQDRQDSQGGQQPQQSGSQGQPGQAPQPSHSPGGDPRLPQFQNQPDMSAREAAGVLQAVENLERQQRQREAARRAQQSAVKEKDW